MPKPRRYVVEITYGDSGLVNVQTKADHEATWSSYDGDDSLRATLRAIADEIEQEEVLLKLTF